MKSFKFFQSTNERVFTDYLDSMDDYFLGGIQRMRWINFEMSNLHFRIYTHLSLGEVQHIVTNTIEPFIFESNNQENTTLILRCLEARFHRAQLIQ